MFSPAIEFSQHGRVLIIDDDLDFLQYIELLFEKYDIHAHGTADTQNCIEIIRNFQPDVVLLDMHMPHRDGLSICTEIRTLPDIRHTPIIFVSASNDEDTRISAFRGLADDFIAKPIIETELIARIGVRLERSQAMREREIVLQQLEKKQQHILSILNQLEVGAIVLDQQQQILFISAHCEKLLDINSDDYITKDWRDLPLDKNSIVEIEASMNQAEPRQKIFLDFNAKKQYISLDIKSDPVEANNYILYFYDMSEIHQLRQQVQQQSNCDIVGLSAPLIEMKERTNRIARGDWTVLIEGETGTGKDLVARQCHAQSPRNEGPFVAINCAGLSESLVSSQLFGHRKGAFTGAIDEQIGLLEAANGGTLFLDEIGDIPISVQVKLLRALEQREIIRIGETKARKIDVRIIAATHKDLKHEVQLGNFREDFLFRIQVARINVPPLRKRREDIPLLTRHFIDSFNQSQDHRLSLEAERALWCYHWPGNIRELKNAIEFSLVNCRDHTIQLSDLPPEITHLKNVEIPSFDEMDETSRIQYALQTCSGNRTQAAKLLGIGRATLYRYMSRLGLA